MTENPIHGFEEEIVIEDVWAFHLEISQKFSTSHLDDPEVWLPRVLVEQEGE